jgi:penicillin amidase
VLPTGQSGNPLADHFGDQSELWISGKYRIFQHHLTIAETADIRTMTLHPATTK